PWRRSPRQMALGLMFYGSTLRSGIYLIQDALRRCGVKPDKDGISAARELIKLTPRNHPVRRFTGLDADLQHDERVADTFLHPQDRAYTVPQILQLLGDAKLHFQAWFS